MNTMTQAIHQERQPNETMTQCAKRLANTGETLTQAINRTQVEQATPPPAPGSQQTNQPASDQPAQNDQGEVITMSNTKDEMIAYASKHGIDITGLSTKAEILAAIEA